MLLVKVVSLIIWSLAYPAAAEQDIWLLGLAPFSGGVWDAGFSLRQAGNLMADIINSNSDILPGYKLKIIWQDTLCAGDPASDLIYRNLFKNEYVQVVANPVDRDGDGILTTSDISPDQVIVNASVLGSKPVGLLGPGYSGAAMAVATVAYYAHLPMISGSATHTSLSDSSSYPNFFRTIVPDTSFGQAWLYIVKQLGISTVAVVLGDSHWFEYGTAFVEDAQRAGVKLNSGSVSNDIKTASGIPFRGHSIAYNKEELGHEIIKALRGDKERVVLIIGWESTLRLLLCQAVKQLVYSIVWLTFGWYSPKWWLVSDTSCTTAQMVSVARSTIFARQVLWRFDQDTALTCANMTSADFKEKFFLYQGRAPGVYMKSSDQQYKIFDEGSTVADAVCMYALTIHEMLMVRNYSLADLEERATTTYEDIQAIFAATKFEGISGRISYSAGSGDPKGGVLMEQLQVGEDPQGKVVSFGTLTDGVFSTFGVNLEFFFPSETGTFAPFAGPAGGTTIRGEIAEFKKTCDGQSGRRLFLGGGSAETRNTTSMDLNFSTNTCVECGEGRVFISLISACGCAKGWYGLSQGGCELCQEGTYQDSDGQGSCNPCPKGRFSDFKGAVECVECPPDTYSDELGAQQCKPCNETFVTQIEGAVEPSTCHCPETTRFINETGRCTTCPMEGIQFIADCPGGYQMGSPLPDETMRIMPGYMSLPSDPGSIFECVFEDDRCPGLRSPYPNASAPMCSGGFVGQACSRCSSGQAQQGTECNPCRGPLKSPLFNFSFGLVCAIIACIFLYCNSMLEQHAAITSFNIVLTYLQAAVVICSFSINLPKPVLRFGAYASILYFDLSVLHIPSGCLFGHSFLAKYIFDLLWPLFLVVGYVIVYLGSHALHRLRSKLRSSPMWTSTYWPVEGANIVNVIMKTHSCLFIMLTRNCMSVLAYKIQPSGIKTLAGYPEATFFSDEWYEALPLCVVALQFYTVSHTIGIFWACIAAPRQYPQSEFFRVALRSCWRRYDPRSWWFCCVQLVFGILLNLIPVLTPNGRIQLMMAAVLVLCYLMLVSHQAPWKYSLNMSTDVFLKIGLFIFIVISNNSPTTSTIDPNVLGVLSLLAFGLPLTVIGVVLVRFLWMNEVAKVEALAIKTEFWQKLHDIVKIAGSKNTLELRAFAMKLEDYDVQNLSQALDTLQYMMLGLQPRSVWGWRCGPSPFEIVQPGRLEGEVIARGLQDPHDYRRVCRKVKTALEEAVPHRPRTSCKSIAGFSGEVIWLMKVLDKNHDHVLTKEEFLTGVAELLGPNTSVTKEDLEEVFRHVDVDGSDRVSLMELAFGLSEAPEPVFPPWYLQQQEAKAAEEQREQEKEEPQEEEPKKDVPLDTQAIQLEERPNSEVEVACWPLGTCSPAPPEDQGADAVAALLGESAIANRQQSDKIPHQEGRPAQVSDSRVRRAI